MMTGGFDSAVRDTVHGWSSPWLTGVMLAVTYLGSDFVLIPVALVFAAILFATGSRREGVLLMCALVLAELVYEGLNIAFHRPRPTPFFGLATPGGHSFPSGHAVKSTVLYVAMTLFPMRPVLIRAVGVALAGVIGFSRIYLGVHYPTDVLAGFALGAICLAACSAVYRRMPVWPSE